MNRILLECPHCQYCFNASEWLVQYQVTNELFEYWSGKKSELPKLEDDKEIYAFLLDEGARMDCPECGEVCCIEDLCEV
jgi:hypothetical protein